ncbi:MAG: adenylyl-sulfate kinase, partial [Vulcanimicrobiaceae bacterium]
AVAGLLADAGQIVIVALISPFARDRDALRAELRHPFHEVYVNAPLAICETRDPKGLYLRARSGALREFTGIDSPYEAPQAPALELRTDGLGIDECAGRLASFIADAV